jgi:hypothetical protein
VFNPEQSLGDARILVRAHTDIRENDTITLHFEGSAGGGSAPPRPFKVLAHWVGRDLPFTVLRSYVLPNLNGSARIYYTLARDNERTRFSHAVEMKVGAALELKVPEVLEATKTGPMSAQINPLHVDTPPVFTVRVRYAPMLDTDDITVFLIGKPGFVPPHITPQPGNPALGYVDFKTSSSSIAAHLGQILKVGYRVTRRGATTGSDELDLRVQAFDELPGNPLPFTTINGIASGGRLDLDTFSGNALAAVAKWPLSATGQRVWMTCSRSGGTPLKVLESYAITSTEAANGLVNKAVLRSWLEDLPANIQITVTCKVIFDGSTNEALALNFPEATYTVTPVFTIDRTQMNLNGFSVKIPGWPKTGVDSIDNTATRQPTGGTPPYSYASSNPAVAEVTATGGKVTGNINGTATITVSDRNGNRLTYPVAVTNVYGLRTNEGSLDFFQAENWMRSVGGIPIYEYPPEGETNRFQSDVNRVYIPPARTKFYWACHRHATIPNHYIFLHRGSPIVFGGAADQFLGAWCLVRL